MKYKEDYKMIKTTPKKVNEPDEVQKAFANMQNKTEIGEVLIQLFNQEKIPMITDLSQDEINLITKIKTISSMKLLPEWDFATNEFMTLKLSKSRGSRREIIEAVRSLGGMQEKTGGSMLNPMNWFRR